MINEYVNIDLEEEVRNLDENKNKFMLFGVILLIVITISAILIFDGINYYDFQDMCFLSIRNDPFSTDKSAISKAVKAVKTQKTDIYSKLCSKITYIWERKCVAPIDNTQPDYDFVLENGCYFKNSNVIFIDPNYNALVDTVKKIE